MATTAESAADATLPRTKEKVSELTKAAALQYTLKNFFNASELYSQAVEIQTELNGELAPENAELLFYYGRALYKNAFQKSDVLGTKVAQEEKKKPKVEKQAAKAVAESSNGAAKGGAKGETVESKPYFQLTGDENWTDSEDDEDAEGGEGEEEEEDDFQNSYGAFEMARVCYEKQLDALGASDSADKGKGKAEITPQQRAIMEKIADCHGFLAEISLENERFHDAVADARKSLALAEQLHAFEDERVSEAHYVLSLALEMASNYKLREDLAAIEPGTSADGTEANQGAQQPEESEIDYDMRNEAAKQTELAIQSVEARLKKENANLAKPDITAEEKKEKEAIIKDKEGALEDLKLRLADLKTDPKSQSFESIDASVFQSMVGGMLGGMDPAAQKAKLQEVTKSANDITGLVKTKKKEKVPAASGPSDSGSSKRKLEVVEEDAVDGKRAKTEDLV